MGLLDPTFSNMFEAGSPEATLHNKLKFFEGELLVKATDAVTRLQKTEAVEHLQRGFIVRHMMMQGSRLEIRDKTIGRKEPLDPYLARDLAIHLNAYYLNLRGALDNLAWAATYEFALRANVDESDYESRRFCSPIGEQFRVALSTSRPKAAALLNTFLPWMRDIARFRDPAAHRIPLTLVSSFLTTDDQEKARDLRARAVEALRAQDIRTWSNLMHEASSLGQFAPVLAAPFGPNGELIVAPNQVAADQEYFLFLALGFIAECFS
jgi:hypothetical protein